jgi:hypothetical protein
MKKFFLPSLLFIFSSSAYINAAEIAIKPEAENMNKTFANMSIDTRETTLDAIDAIINGRFEDHINYLDILPSPKSERRNDQEVDPAMIAYAYEVLGQHYMTKKDASKAATSYFYSLQYCPFNEELIYYLRKTGVTNFSNENNIRSALEKIAIR